MTDSAAFGVRLREIEARADRQACQYEPDDCACGACATRRDVYALAAELERVTAERAEAFDSQGIPRETSLADLIAHHCANAALAVGFDRIAAEGALAAAVAESARLQAVIRAHWSPEQAEAILAEALAGGAAAPPLLATRIVQASREAYSGVSALLTATEGALAAAVAESARLREYVVAHTLLEQGKVDFDLHAATVARFERAAEAVADVTGETLAGGAAAPPPEPPFDPRHPKWRFCREGCRPAAGIHRADCLNAPAGSGRSAVASNGEET